MSTTLNQGEGDGRHSDEEQRRHEEGGVVQKVHVNENQLFNN